MDRILPSQSRDAIREGLFDELLVTLIWAGDRAAAERLAIRWQPRLLRTARRLIGHEEEALAAVQDSWLSILRGLPRLDDPARFRPWAFSILRRRCVDSIRGLQSRRARDGGDADMLEMPAPGDEPEERIAILQAFAALPHEQRLAAHLFYIEGLTLAEIAAASDIPAGTVKSRLFHARKRLKQVLETEPKGELR